jgi:thiol-disulfide isomerase/thioredoxin
MNQQRWVLALAGIVVVIAAVAAFGLGGAGTPVPSATPSASPSATATPVPSPSASPSEAASPSPTDASTPNPSPSGSAPVGSGPTIEGTVLPLFEQSAGDPAIGMQVPVASGPSFDGTTVTIGEPGRPQIILFLAHWCPHCQREVPLLQDWIDANGMPAGVDLLSVATSIDSNAPNYPPDAWLAAEGWTVPTLVDPENTVADAYGLAGFPYWVFTDADGKVAVRTIGELTIEQIEQAIALILAG